MKSCRAFRTLSAVFAFIVLCVFSAAGNTLTDQSLARLAAKPPVCDDVVDFVVCADPQPGGLLGTPQVFLDMLDEWNVLQPDLVMCVGDMIMGGPADVVGSMWDEFLGNVGKLQVPFFPTAGNHDVNPEPAVMSTYEERVSPFYYSVVRGNSEFIVLNTEEPGNPDGFSPSQRKWLEKTLVASKARHIFIFLHVPLFRGNWARDWQHMEDLFVQYPVRVVFAGHEHLYRDWGTHKGIRYVVAGSAGGGFRTPEEEGGMFCYLWVKVRGEEVSWSVVRPGAVLPSDVVTETNVQKLHALQKILDIEEIAVHWNSTLDQKIEVRLHNPFSEEISSTFRWEIPEGWTVTPASHTFKVAPGTTEVQQCHVKTDGAFRFPSPVLQGKVEAEELVRTLELSPSLDVKPQASAPQAPGKVVLDGDLSEWSGAVPLPMLYGSSYDPAETEDLQAQARLMWDENNLYIAVEVEDNEFHQPHYGDVVWMADSVELWVEDSNWSFSLTESGPQVFLDERPDKHLDAVIDGVPLAVKRDGRRTVYEAAYPAEELPQIACRAGSVIRFSILVNDLDPSGPLTKRHYAELTPGAGAHFDCAKYFITLEAAR